MASSDTAKGETTTWRPRTGLGGLFARTPSYGYLLSALLVLSVLGCSGSSATARPTGTATPVPSPSATETPSPSSTVAPTPQLGFVQTSSGLAWNSGDGQQLTVPAIPGLIAALSTDGQTVQYVALTDNPYGLKADAVGGYFNPLVSVEGTQVGGLALEAHVAAWYLQHTADVAGIPPILSPVDFRTATNVSISNGTILSLTTGKNYTDIEIVATGKVSIRSNFPGMRTLLVSGNETYGTDVYESVNQAGETGDKWTCLHTFAPGLPPLAQLLKPTQFSFGQEIGTIENATKPILLSSHTTASGFSDIDTSGMVRIRNSVVSVFQQRS